MATIAEYETGGDVGGILKAGRWRRLRITAWMIILFLAIGIASALTYALIRKAAGNGTTAVLGAEVAIAALSIFLYRLAVLKGEKRRPEEIAGSWAIRETLIGLAVGAGMMTATVGILAGTGLYSLHFGVPQSAWDEIGMAIRSGVAEEVLFRAILLRLLWRAFGPLAAFGLSAALFGALHLGNPNASLFAALCIAIEAGIMLGAFYALTGRIWVSIGVHAGWNFTQGWVFGAAVSGFAEKGTWGVSTPDPAAAAYLSGGPFGPEASLPGLAVGTLVGAGTLWLAWQRGRLGRTLD
ncbi:MAG TPA: type II CAAX endopeptidase family protein [Allosphingosinicella sp.]